MSWRPQAAILYIREDRANHTDILLSSHNKNRVRVECGIGRKKWDVTRSHADNCRIPARKLITQK